MKVKKSKLEPKLDLLERLIAQVRLTCRHGDPETIMFAGEVLGDLVKRKAELERTETAPLPGLVEHAA